MYKIYADGTLIYDSTVEDYKIGGGVGSLEVNKSGTFSFSLYPDHFYYDKFVKLKTVVMVTKSDRIIFRGRVLDDYIDYWNKKVLTCEGELGFLQDSIIRPFSFSGTPEELFYKFVNDHNAQVDEYKRFNIGEVTVLDKNNYIARSNSAYETSLSNLNSRLIEDSLGGYFHVTHGADGMDPVPTLNYLSDFTRISTQLIEFGANLKDYIKKSSGQEIATAIIPLGAEIDDGNADTDDPRLTIASVNNGVDYVYDEAAVAAHGWIFDTVIFDDVTLPENLKDRGLAELARRIREDITVELTAVDLHLLDRSIESFRYGTYVRVISPPHNFAETLLCHRQTFNLLKPDSDTVTLGSRHSSFTGSAAKTAAVVSAVPEVQRSVSDLNRKTAAYKIAEQKLTNLLAQSFGFFKTEQVLEDGSIICYLHDKPTLAESMNIWKMTGDVMAVSSDGGQTWNAGIDAFGNAVMNILSVIGIDASWINADNLTAISSNLGGWEITERGIYKEIIDVDDPNYIFRIYINVPRETHVEFALTEEIIKIESYNMFTGETGVFFSLLGHGGMRLGDRSNNTYCELDGSRVTAYATGYGDAGHYWNGFEVKNDAGQTIGYLKRPFVAGSGSGHADFTVCYAKQVICDSAVAYDAYSGDINIGGIVFQFRGGVLANAYYA